MPYDPREFGALCSRCPLSGMEIVPPEEARGYPFAILVGEIPGAEEAKQGRPFVGPSGWEMNRALQAVGIRRNRCHVTNAVLCHPPGAASGALDRIDKQVATRRKNGDTEVLTPVEACRPRLLREIEGLGCKDVVPLGGVAMRAITGMRSKILEVRGGPQNVGSLRMLPTVHPAFVMRSRRWTGAFVADLGRAMRWFTSGLRWQDPVTLFRPSPAQLRAWIARSSRAVIYDVETAPAFPSPKASECRYDPMRDPLRVVGLCNEDARSATVIPFRSKEDVGRSFYTLSEYRELIDILRAFFVSSKIKVGWNSGYYDRMVIESHFKVTPSPHIDLIGLHKFVEPELPHSLGYAGSIYTDVNAWKQGRPAESSETDQDLWTYNAKDTAVTAMSMGPIVQAVKDRKQEKPAAFWPFVQDLCVQLHRNGMHVDQVKRQEWDAKMLRLAQEHLATIRDTSGRPRINPGSFPQVGGLLFDDWELLPVNYTEGGEPSTDDESLREIMAKQTLTPAQRTTIENVRLYRRRCKYRGTYTQKLRPMNEPPVAEAFSFDEEAEEEDKVLDRLKRGRPKSGVILADGRVHGDWNAHGTLGWRISSSAPNLQNYPNLLRDMIDAAPGWCLVGCDQAQLELRMVAAMAGARAYLAAFAAGGDPHGELCLATFGATYENAAKDAKKLFRRFVKEGTYACAEVGTHVVTLGSEGSKPIETLIPGEDWTWSWDGKKYAPAKIVDKRSHGMRECVRVKFKWSGGNSNSVVFTKDHRFMLRNGAYRRADELKIGDALMPFTRIEYPNGYRMIDQCNDLHRVVEHRAVAEETIGFGETIHHRNRIRNDNRPENLEVTDPSEHAKMHWNAERRVLQRDRNVRLWVDGTMNEKLTAGRLASSVWRAVNRKNYEKMRAGLDSWRASGGSIRGEIRGSVLDEFRDKIGVLPDRDIAKLAGVSQAMVSYYRKTRKIPPPPGQRVNHRVVSIENVGPREVWDIEVDHPTHNFAIAAGVFVHNSVYQAEIETVHSVLASAEDQETERLVFPDISISKVAAFHRVFTERNPEIPIWWETLEKEFRDRGYLTEDVLGLRCDFLDGIKDPQLGNKMSNFKAQSGGSAIVHIATKRFVENMPKDWHGRVFIVNQGHDSLTCEVKMDGDLPSRVGKFLEECFTIRGEEYGLPVPFLGEMKVGPNWKET